MRTLFIIAVLALAGCVAPEWPEAGKNPSGWGAISISDLLVLRPGDTAGDVMKKMGRPGGEIPVPWFTYSAADHEGQYYIFRFALKKKELRPTDRLTSVELVALGDKVAPIVVWPSSK